MGEITQEKYINPDGRATVFIDLDGCLVKHNYYPLTSPDEWIDGSLRALLDLKKGNRYVILVTSRTKVMCEKILAELKQEHGFEFDREYYELPTGPRIVINDYKVEPLKEPVLKAIAYNIERDQPNALLRMLHILNR